MRILILDTYYPEAQQQIYESHPGLERQPYAEQSRTVYDFGFARADFLPRNLRDIGHETEQFIVNVPSLQRRWGEERGVLPKGLSQVVTEAQRVWKNRYRSLKRRLGSVSPTQRASDWELKVLDAQVEAFQPDIIFICDVLYLPSEVHDRLKEKTRLLVGEMAYPIPKGLDLRAFDLILSAAPHYVDRLRDAGLKAEFLRLAFEPSILNRLGNQPKTHGAVFVGSLSGHHEQRLRVLEEVSRRVPLTCWGTGGNDLPPDSPLRGTLRPPLWGYDMYRQLQRARIALNIHIDMAENYAANMRLYEATGVGAMLVTDWKSNLHELFEPGKEVVAYRTPAECAELIEYYLSHDEEREEIARAGQKRTLREHTYPQRMLELSGILKRHLDRQEGSRSVSLSHN
jgi:spore maturation protein CgeB